MNKVEAIQVDKWLLEEETKRDLFINTTIENRVCRTTRILCRVMEEFNFNADKIENWLDKTEPILNLILDERFPGRIPGVSKLGSGVLASLIEGRK